MAYVSNIQLTVSAIGGGSVANKAEVKCTIHFYSNEVIADQKYYIQAALWEEDEARDIFVMRPNGKVVRQQPVGDGDGDDFVGTIQNTTIRPNGNPSVNVTLSREWTFSDLDDILPPSMEKFFATVSVIPELARGDWKFSPVVYLDVG